MGEKTIVITRIYKLLKLSLTKLSWTLERPRRESGNLKSGPDRHFGFVFSSSSSFLMEGQVTLESRAVAILLVREEERGRES